MRGVSALSGTKDSVPIFESWRRIRGRGGEDDAGKFATGDPWERWLVLVFTADLKEVEEIGSGCVNCDQVLVGRRGRIGEGGDDEVSRALDSGLVNGK